MGAEATPPAPRITTIIPTTGETARARGLERAIASVVNQSGVSAELLVVVNGSGFDGDLLQALRNRSDITVLYLPEANVSLARLEGLKHVASPYFGFLDDDDEYLPDALRVRASILDANPEIDVLVTNGFMDDDAAPIVTEERAEYIRREPARSCLENNWFGSPAPTFRRATVPVDTFSTSMKYFEWTTLLFKLLARGLTIVFEPTPTFRIHSNPLSVHKGLDYRLAEPGFLKELKRLPLPPDIKKRIDKNYIDALHMISSAYLSKGDHFKSFQYHFRCLLGGGWSYLPYTRRILYSLLKPRQHMREEA